MSSQALLWTVLVAQLLPLGTTSEQSNSGSNDAFRTTAVRALRGDFGPLQPWQRRAYSVGLAQGVRADKTAWLTHYLGSHADGKRDRWGNPCTLRHAAARDEQIPSRYRDEEGKLRLIEVYVWTPFGVRQVLDTGAKSNIRRAQRPPDPDDPWKGGAGPGAIWIDYWYPARRDAPFGVAIVPLAVIRP